MTDEPESVEHVVSGVVQVLADRDDLSVLGENVGLEGEIGGDDCAFSASRACHTRTGVWIVRIEMQDAPASS